MLKTISLVPMQIDILAACALARLCFVHCRDLLQLDVTFLGGVGIDGESVGKGAGMMGWGGLGWGGGLR